MRKLVDVLCFVGGGLMIILHYTRTKVFDFINWQVEGRYGNYTKGLDDYICPALLPVGVALVIFGFLYNKWQQKDNNSSFDKTLLFIIVLTLFIANLIYTNRLSEKVDKIINEIEYNQSWR